MIVFHFAEVLLIMVLLVALGGVVLAVWDAVWDLHEPVSGREPLSATEIYGHYTPYAAPERLPEWNADRPGAHAWVPAWPARQTPLDTDKRPRAWAPLVGEVIEPEWKPEQRVSWAALKAQLEAEQTYAIAA